MLGRTDSRLRLVLLLCVMGAFAAALTLRLAYWQIGVGPDLQRIAEAQLANPVVANIERGDILDRRGEILATTAYRDRLVAFPDVLVDASGCAPGDECTDDERYAKSYEIADRVAGILGYDDGRKAAVREQLSDRTRQYVVVEDRLTQEQSDQIRSGLESKDLIALGLEAQPMRFYPSVGGSPGTTLASQLLGFVTNDGQGRYGVEQASQDLLAGSAGPVANADDEAPLPTTGGTVQLTIDASLQLRLERELYAAWVTDKAQRVSGIVMDPYTGAILAWASVPGYDANAYSDIAQSSPEMFVDPLISQIYEPGSVMKMFTAAAALEQGVVTPQSIVQDSRILQIGDNRVRNFDRESMGAITFEDAIAHSRNVATGLVALMLGDTTDEASAVLFDMWTRLGIGSVTGIELGNEAAGIVPSPVEQKWHAIDLVNRAFGQAVAVTPLQLATSFAAMVNGGNLPTPHIYAALNGETRTAPAATPAISEELSAKLRDMMVYVAEEGPRYAQETLIDGYVVGGKTGTAQIWDSRSGSWLENVYNHTFVGFVGAERPEAVILVRIHDTEPSVHRRGRMTLEMTSNALFRRVAQGTIEALDIEPLPSAPGPLVDGPEDSYEYPPTVDETLTGAGGQLDARMAGPW
jgi:cell division protein FtsI (penicillin-binding protein 3)